MTDQQQKAFYEELVRRYRAKTITDDELAVFSYLFQEGRLDEVLTESMDAYWLPSLDKARVVPIKFRFWRWAAAAAVLIGISTVTYFLNQRNRSATAVVPATTADIAPGGNKATLTLAGGAQIILDSAHNGLLTRQGNTNVVKSASGELAYNKSTAAANEKSIALSYNTLTTPRGGAYQLTLPDGTKVWLNAASSITFPTAFTGNERKVTVIGEAYFEVVHNSRMPFRVQANNQLIEDIGTAFDINAYADEKTINTTLIQGSVEVLIGKKPNSYGVFLKPGEQSELNKNGEINIIKDANLEQVMAWKNGFFQFNRTDIQTVMRQISRWYDVDVVYQGAIPTDRFGGRIPRDANASQVLKALEETQVHFRIEGKKIIVMP